MNTTTDTNMDTVTTQTINHTSDKPNPQPRPSETQAIDQIMSIVEDRNDLEMSDTDYKSNPYFVNPALVKSFILYSISFYLN